MARSHVRSRSASRAEAAAFFAERRRVSSLGIFLGLLGLLNVASVIFAFAYA